MTDDHEQTSATPAPSPQLFARPGPPPGAPRPAPESAPESAPEMTSSERGSESSDPDETPTGAPTGAPANGPADAEPVTAGGRSSRFPSTGDPRVDQALAQLPDPKEHRHGDTADAFRGEFDGARALESAGGEAGSGETPGATADEGGPEAVDGVDDAVSGLELPDPGLLDAHLRDVSSVHRQLQQRLSDLSG